MISESKYWKDSLGRDAALLSRLSSIDDENVVFRMERIVFISAYSMRKLIDSNKITDTVRNSRVSAVSYERLGESALRPWNLDAIDRHYALNDGLKREFDLEFLLNQVIHSRVFLFSSMESGSVDGFFVCSDRKASSELYHIKISDYISIMKLFSKNYPTGMHWRLLDGKEEVEIV